MKRGLSWIAALFFAGAAIMHADCYSFDQAPKHVGEIVCIRGRVMKVSASSGGTHYLNFCENFLTCPFTVVVFPGKLETIGDVRSLQDQEIEIDGLVKLYKGRPEIVLAEANQLRGDVVSRIPPLPRNYDVAEHGKFSVGSFHAKKPKRSKTRRAQQDQTDPNADFSVPQ
jgi:hypothetical protein